ncbi:MAG: hypothetical protein J3Q66DRAFT_375168 [Benniella sp.]|nr:MAG: hypothetical protein J3Q66DRAFT_375168 [Benniella sp.]
MSFLLAKLALVDKASNGAQLLPDSLNTEAFQTVEDFSHSADYELRQVAQERKLEQDQLEISIKKCIMFLDSITVPWRLYFVVCCTGSSWNGSSRTRSARSESSRTLPGRTKSFWYLASRFSSFWKLPRGCGSPWRVPSGCESSLVPVEVPGSSGSSLFGLEALYSL